MMFARLTAMDNRRKRFVCQLRIPSVFFVNSAHILNFTGDSRCVIPKFKVQRFGLVSLNRSNPNINRITNCHCFETGKMMLNTLIILFALLLLSGLLYFEKKENRKGLLPTKSILSALFIIAVLVQPHPIGAYYRFVLVGLIFCLGGDVFLALPQKKMFLIGLVSFLIGHIFYIFGFFSVSVPNAWTWGGTLAALLVSGLVYQWLRPHLGTMNIPVLFYVVVITAMVSGAWTVLGNLNLALSGRILVICGALSFYFSDIFVARDRFVKKEFLNRLVGLPLYYAGQFLLAFSVGILQ